MGDDKSSVPNAPQFQYDPDVGWSKDFGKKWADYLTSGLTGASGGIGGMLGEAMNISPEVSRLSQQLAQSQLDPAFRQKRQQTINDLEANNQLTGSTTASALGNLDADYMASLTGMQAQYGLADVERALNNRMQGFAWGLNSGQNVGSMALENQNQMNQFALANYENQVAAAMMNQKDSGGWLSGGAMGGLLGAGLGVAGAALAPATFGTSLLASGVAGGALGAGLGAGLGAFGGNSAVAQGLGGMSQLGGYAIGSKYAPQAYTYTRGPESVTNTTAAYQPLGSYVRQQGLV